MNKNIIMVGALIALLVVSSYTPQASSDYDPKCYMSMTIPDHRYPDNLTEIVLNASQNNQLETIYPSTPILYGPCNYP